MRSKDESKPNKPKKWSPCRCEIKIWFNPPNLTPCRLITTCVASAQSTRYICPLCVTTCAVALRYVVGSAEPQPNILTLKDIIKKCNSGITKRENIKKTTPPQKKFLSKGNKLQI